MISTSVAQSMGLPLTPAQTATTNRQTRRCWLAVGLLALLSGAGRAIPMGSAPVWYDEVFTLRIVAPGAPGSLWMRVQDTESTPPLFYALSWLVRNLGIDGAASIRLVSVAAAALVVVVAFWATRRFFSARVALGTAAIVAVHPMISTYAIDGRSYSLLLLIAFGITGMLGQALARPDARTLAAFAILATLACWTHYFAVFLVIPAVLVLLVLRPEARRGVLLATVGWAVACLPLLDLVLHQGNDSRAGFIGDRSLTGRAVMAGRELLGGNPNGSNLVEALALLLAMTGIGLALAAAVRRRGGPPRDTPPFVAAPEVLLATLAVTAIGLPLLISVVSEHYDRFFGRNVIVALPAIIMLVSAGLTQSRKVGLVALAALFGAMVVGSYAVLLDWRYGQSDVPGALREAGPSIREVPILTNEPRQVVLPYLLQRAPSPADAPLTTDRLDMFLGPERPGTRTLTPTPVPPQVDRLRAAGFTVVSNTVFHGVRRLVLRAAAPIAIPTAVTAPFGVYLPPPVTDRTLQSSLLGDRWR